MDWAFPGRVDDCLCGRRHHLSAVKLGSHLGCVRYDAAPAAALEQTSVGWMVNPGGYRDTVAGGSAPRRRGLRIAWQWADRYLPLRATVRRQPRPDLRRGGVFITLIPCGFAGV